MEDHIELQVYILRHVRDNVYGTSGQRHQSTHTNTRALRSVILTRGSMISDYRRLSLLPYSSPPHNPSLRSLYIYPLLLHSHSVFSALLRCTISLPPENRCSFSLHLSVALLLSRSSLSHPWVLYFDNIDILRYIEISTPTFSLFFGLCFFPVNFCTTWKFVRGEDGSMRLIEELPCTNGDGGVVEEKEVRNLDENEWRPAVNGEFPSQKKVVVVGYALTSKKIKSFLQPKLECLAR